jgi:disulfide bond formation protein DsbB
MAAALYFQYVMQLEPCPLCILQRIFVIVVGLILLAGAIHNPGITQNRGQIIVFANIPSRVLALVPVR